MRFCTPINDRNNYSCCRCNNIFSWRNLLFHMKNCKTKKRNPFILTGAEEDRAPQNVDFKIYLSYSLKFAANF